MVNIILHFSGLKILRQTGDWILHKLQHYFILFLFYLITCQEESNPDSGLLQLFFNYKIIIIIIIIIIILLKKKKKRRLSARQTL